MISSRKKITLNTRSPIPSSRGTEPLSDQRYEDLLKRASVFFASAVGPSADERQAVMEEIQAVMGRYGFTPGDLA